MEWKLPSVGVRFSVRGSNDGEAVGGGEKVRKEADRVGVRKGDDEEESYYRRQGSQRVGKRETRETTKRRATGI